uniref:Uncharacterized protein n=1 Tax=Meloidogyne floridensis TaxID=298350 RepID=A0A915P238_9BILA
MSTILPLFLIISMISFQITNAYNPYKYGPIGWALLSETIIKPSGGYGYGRPSGGYGYGRPSGGYGYGQTSGGYGGNNYANSFGYPAASPNGYPPDYAHGRR